jgi:hypothetical protein
VVSFTFLVHDTLCVPRFKWHYGAPYFPLHISLNALDHNQLMAIKGLEKGCIANEDATPALQRHP